MASPFSVVASIEAGVAVEGVGLGEEHPAERVIPKTAAQSTRIRTKVAILRQVAVGQVGTDASYR